MQYYCPDTIEAAVALAEQSQGTLRYLAGGTDVLVQLRSDMVTPDVLIDTKHIPGAGDIAREGDGWRIGIAVSGAEMSEHPELHKEWPGIVEAMDLIGSTQIQGRATLVGNLCNASPAADSVPTMIAAGVTASVQGPSGERVVPVEDLLQGPGKTSLTKGEIVTSLHIPARGERGGDAYQRFIPRTEMDIAVVGCGVNLKLSGDGAIESARVSLGAVAPTALLVEAAADAIVGTKLDDGALEALANAASDACSPIEDKRGTIKFRTHVAGVLARRVAQIAYDRAGAAQ